VGVAVPRLPLALLLGELGAQVELVVVVGAVRREEGPEGVEEEVEAVASVVETSREAVVEIAGGGVERSVEGLLVPREDVTGFGLDTLGDVDGLEAARRLQG